MTMLATGTSAQVSTWPQLAVELGPAGLSLCSSSGLSQLHCAIACVRAWSR
jgi:hypothetical protein